MKINTTSLGARLDLRLAAYAATGAAVAMAAVVTHADASVVYSGPVSIAVPNTLNGIYLNLVTGVSGTATVATGWDFNPYGNSSGLTFYSPSSPAGTLDTGTTAQRLTGGEIIGLPSSTFGSGLSNGSQFQTGGYGYIGIRFLNETTAAYDYGWVLLSTTASTGFPATIIGYAYENTGGAILAGQIGGNSPLVPEPGTVAALSFGALALGASGVRRWRKGRQAA